LKEQAGDVVAVDAGYFHAYMKETGLYWEDDAEIVAGPIGAAFEPGGRLTLTTATPVTTADVTAAATLYYTPYKHDMISLYDGARWIPKTFAELSLNIAAYTASKPYDIWAYLNAGAVALESTVWTNATTRATALAYQNGRLVKSGTVTRLYLGTIYVNSSGGQTDDALLKRNVYNYYNRVSRPFLVYDQNGHSYGTATWRSWNANDALRIQVMTGVVEEIIEFDLWTSLTPGAVGRTPNVSFAIDATNSYYDSGASNTTGILLYTAGTAAQRFGLSVTHLPAVGFHFYQLTENAADGAASTFNAAGLQGFVMA